MAGKRGEIFAVDQADWSKSSYYIKQMYDVIYDNMLFTGISKELDSSILMDEKGYEVDFEDPKNVDISCDIKVLHTDLNLLVNEIGCNTNQRKDGHIGGTKYAVEKYTIPNGFCSITN
jgi:hypothetical protein